jgi:NhaP-type Na+/H+ or K+/H+ antiporter
MRPGLARGVRGRPEPSTPEEAVYVVIGLLLVFMALAGSVLRRLPVSTAMLYLVVGVALGPRGTGTIVLDPLRSSALLERLTEIGVIISLFTAGLKLRVSPRDPLWRPAVRLAFLSMTLTVALVAAVGVLGLGLPLGAAVLLGAVLAPTDPVLAADVQVADPGDRDRLRFTLTAEAGLNDGAAFPFVMLGLGLMGLHDLGWAGWRWLAVDAVWAVAAGLGIGWALGTVIARLVVYLRREYRTALGLDEFLTLGLIALAYGAALLAHAYGFLAVFAAGLALRRVERKATARDEPIDPGRIEEPREAAAGAAAGAAAASDPRKAPAYMAHAVLGFNEQLERIGEVALVLLLGAMLVPRLVSVEALWAAPLLFLLIRPAAVFTGLAGSAARPAERQLMAWFGIRGIGSLYYLAYALGRGVPPDVAERLAALTLTLVAVSVFAHGISVTPLMARYERRRRTPAA